MSFRQPLRILSVIAARTSRPVPYSLQGMELARRWRGGPVGCADHRRRRCRVDRWRATGGPRALGADTGGARSGGRPGVDSPRARAVGPGGARGGVHSRPDCCHFRVAAGGRQSRSGQLRSPLDRAPGQAATARRQPVRPGAARTEALCRLGPRRCAVREIPRRRQPLRDFAGRCEDRTRVG